MNLKKLGYNSFFEAYFNEYASAGQIPGRIAIQNLSNFTVYTELGELLGEVSGKFRFEVENGTAEVNGFPAVGDWVLLRPFPAEGKAIIDKILPRKNKFSRKEAGEKTVEQIVAANIDIVFIVNALNHDFNLRRLERYLTTVMDNEIRPVIILSKADLADDLDARLEEVRDVVGVIPIHAISVKENFGLEELGQYFVNNNTVAVLGSSGVGKSTLINTLAGEEKFFVQEVSDFSNKGKHTTTHREMIILDNGGLIIDTPGMRELQLWEGGEGVAETFDDLEELSLQCKFSDCLHKDEPGCAIRAAINMGEVDETRLKSYLKLMKEVKYLESKQNVKTAIENKKKWKQVHKSLKDFDKKNKGKRG
ncbi:MAG: ribosome small subunit-dependent GTPase A [Ignavibacteria bacterium]|nr:ribosome small subunit-dependent GTPase A [Ignavibacteria bacterium]